MSQADSVIGLEFTDLHLDGDPSTDAYDIMLRVVATFDIHIDGSVFFSEEEFPIVELAVDLGYWLKHGDANEFRYESLEYEGILVWFKPEAEGWRVGSDLRERPSDRVFTLEEVREAAASYIDRVRREVKDTLDVDVTPAFRLRH